eukprot:COSAG05_NODE_44_length_25563_cov_118.074419_5_plen_108_part_00
MPAAPAAAELGPAPCRIERYANNAQHRKKSHALHKGAFACDVANSSLAVRMLVGRICWPTLACILGLTCSVGSSQSQLLLHMVVVLDLVVLASTVPVATSRSTSRDP